MKNLAFLALVGLTFVVLSSCGGSDGTFSQSPGTNGLQFFNREATFGLDAGRTVAPLTRRSTTIGEITIFGTRAASGAPASILQAAVQERSRAEGSVARAVFDATGKPTRVTNSDDGLLLSLEWGASSVAFKFFSSTGLYQAGATVPLTGAFAATKLTAPAKGGVYQGNLAGAADGIFSIEITGTDDSKTVQLTGCTRCGDKTRLSTADWLADFKALGGLVGKSDSDLFLKRTFGAVFTSGSAANMEQIIKTAFGAGNANGSAYLQSAKKFASALVAHLYVLDGIPADLTADEYVKRGSFAEAKDDSGAAAYALSTSITDPFTDSDPTFVTGLGYSRDWGSVPLTGSVNAAGAFTCTGTTAAGDQLRLTGTAGPTSGATGNWQITGAAPGGGGLNGTATAPGTCNASSGSGGQGGTIRTFNMGQSCGTVPFSYQMYTIPDQAIVTQGSAELFRTSGLVSGSQTVNLKLVGGKTTTVTVIIFAPNSGTAWDFSIGCPGKSGVPAFTGNDCEVPPQ